MKKALFALLALAVTAVVTYRALQPEPAEFAETPPPALEEGFRYLYNGESLEGWRTVGGGATFEASGDDIVGRHGPGKNTFLRTEQTYSDFNLRMQVRWEEEGNSGVLFRAQQRNGKGRAYGYQYELDPSDRSWSGGIYDEARRGWIANLENNAEARNALRRNAWNDVEIEAQGARIKTWINGVPAASVIDSLDAEGFIALQIHSGKSGVVRWRSIRIRELAAASTPGESLLAASEWRNSEAENATFSATGFSAALTEADVWYEPRRKFKDAMMRMTVPACDSPTTIQMRYRMDDPSPSFAEVKVYADRAQARLVTPEGEQLFDPVKLVPADTHSFVSISLDQAVVLTIDEQDALRVNDTPLDPRGQLRILPARCGERFTVEGPTWFSLKTVNNQPLFYQTLDTPPAPVLTPEQALDAFSIAPGFEIELVAAEPLVEDPVALSWDEHGRLYVVEMRGYMPDAYGTGSNEPVGQVVRLTDNDGDGRMDSSEVFLGNLVNPRAIAVVNDGVLIGEPPNLWLCELPTRDALCTNKRSVGVYGANVGSANVEHMENGLRQGLDNWLYNAKSSRRLKLIDGKLVEEEGLFRGQWGITKDNVGRLLYNHNSTWLQADFFQAEDLLRPYNDSRVEGLAKNLTPSPDVYSVRVNPGVNRAYLDNTLREDGRLAKATGVSGLVAYRGDQFPARYQGDLFVPESAGNVVAQFALRDEGVAMRAQQRLYDDPNWGQRDFLASTDERFRPVDAMNGPDGALYIIDMYRGIIQDDHFLTDELREQIFERDLDEPVGLGRIWRVRHAEGTEATEMPELGAATPEVLIGLLSHDNGWVRDTAQRLLLPIPGDYSAPLQAVASGENALAALHALWVLEGRGELDSDLVVALAKNHRKDHQRAINALRAGRSTLGKDDVLDLLAQQGRIHEGVVVQLLVTAGDHVADVDVRAAIAQWLADSRLGTFGQQAALRALVGQEYVFLQELLAANSLNKPGKQNSKLLSALSNAAYRNLRPDLTSDEPATSALMDFLSLIASRDGKQRWQQVAMLKGLRVLPANQGFVPAQLAAAPPIFSDSAVSEKSPLWKARLAARRAFTWPGDEIALGLTPLSPEQLQLMALGKAFYPKCGACHGEDGAGIAGLAPPLAAASWVTGPPEWLGRIILQGMSGPVEVAGEVFDGVMPPHGHLPELDDRTLAGLMTFLRRSWSNAAGAVSVEQVAAIRKASAARTSPWTVSELQAVPIDRGLGKFAGKYRVSFVTFTVSESAGGLKMSVPMYGEGAMQQLEETVFTASAGGESVKVEFVVEDDGSVNKMIVHRDGEKIPVSRVE